MSGFAECSKKNPLRIELIAVDIDNTHKLMLLMVIFLWLIYVSFFIRSFFHCSTSSVTISELFGVCYSIQVCFYFICLKWNCCSSCPLKMAHQNYKPRAAYNCSHNPSNEIIWLHLYLFGVIYKYTTVVLSRVYNIVMQTILLLNCAISVLNGKRQWFITEIHGTHTRHTE